MTEKNNHRLRTELKPPRIILGQIYPLKTDFEKAHSRRLIKVLDDLHQSITPSERWKSLERAHNCLSHDIKELHSNEISMGMDKALCLKLGYAVVTMRKDAYYVSKEIVLICRCFIQILQCSHERRLWSFRNVGINELMPLLIQIWTITIQNKIKIKVQSPEDDEGLLSIIQIVRVFSKLIPAKSCLIEYLNGAFLGKIMREILIWMKDPDLSILFSFTDILWEALGLLKDLTFRSKTRDKAVLIGLEGGLLMKIIFVCCRSIESVHHKVQGWCISIIWNLALDRSISRLMIAEDVGNSENFNYKNIILNGLLQTLKIERVDAVFQKVKRDAISAIGNMISDSRQHTFLFHGSGAVTLSALLHQFINLVKDSDPVVRRRSMRTIRCLAYSTDSITKSFLEEDTIALLLVDVISQNLSDDDESEDDYMIALACQTILALSRTIKVEVWSILESVLIKKVEVTTFLTVIINIIQCLNLTLKKIPSARSPSSEKFWKHLEMSALSNLELHAPISSLLVTLAKLERKFFETEKKASILTSTTVINMVSSILLESRPKQGEQMNQTLEFILVLAENDNNKRQLAENDNLLSSLVSSCLIQQDTKNKDLIKQVILKLVPEI